MDFVNQHDYGDSCGNVADAERWKTRKQCSERFVAGLDP